MCSYQETDALALVRAVNATASIPLAPVRRPPLSVESYGRKTALRLPLRMRPVTWDRSTGEFEARLGCLMNTTGGTETLSFLPYGAWTHRFIRAFPQSRMPIWSQAGTLHVTVDFSYNAQRIMTTYTSIRTLGGESVAYIIRRGGRPVD